MSSPRISLGEARFTSPLSRRQLVRMMRRRRQLDDEIPWVQFPIRRVDAGAISITYEI
jgi:hypothetical protein